MPIYKLHWKGTFPQSKTLTLTGVASFLILPHDNASSGLAPLSDPSNSDAVFRKTLKSAPFR